MIRKLVLGTASVFALGIARRKRSGRSLAMLCRGTADDWARAASPRRPLRFMPDDLTPTLVVDRFKQRRIRGKPDIGHQRAC